MSLCMCLVGVAMWFVNDYSQYSTWLLVIALFIYLALYSIGMGATPNIVNSEIYPIHLRGIGNSIATMGTWLSNYLISAVFLTAIETKIGEVVIFFIDFVRFSFIVCYLWDLRVFLCCCFCFHLYSVAGNQRQKYRGKY